jgi:hypothetical protein
MKGTKDTRYDSLINEYLSDMVSASGSFVLTIRLARSYMYPLPVI